MEPYIDNQFQHHQSQQSNSGLLRFRSAPSSLLSSFKGYDFNQSPVPESNQSIPVSETKGIQVCLNGYSGFDPNQLPPQYPKPGSVMDSPFRVEVSNSMAMDQSTQGKVVSNLTRQSSSPAGFFSQLNAQNAGYGMVRGIGGESSPRSSRLKPQIDFSQGLSTSLGRLPRIPEIGAEMAKESEMPNEKCRNGEDDSGRFYNSTGYAFASWNDPSLSEGPSSLQNGSLPHRPHMLSHHLSLPKTSAEMEAVEKLLNFQDSVPCKIRAKRGCATHPRSIAERVRRTRISDRMKKLQDLVPNMDKQVNTADMLDFAVDYIKELQKQYKKLSDNRARCECVHLQQSAATDEPS